MTKRHALAAGLMGMALALSCAGPAQADFEVPPPPADGGGTGSTGPSAPLPDSSTGAGSDSGGSRVGRVKNCSVVSSPAYLGVSCGSASGGGASIKDILGSDPVPDCWNEALTASELAAMGLANTEGPAGSTWYWERCLEGIDPKTFKVAPGGVTFTIGLESIRNGEPVKRLTTNQQRLVTFRGADQQIPAPIAGVSPAAHPRVGAWVSFFDGSPTTVTASGGGAVLLRARVTSLEVFPLGQTGGARVACPGTGVKAVKGDTPSTKSDGCWFRYPESSSAQPDQKYPVRMVAHWTVDVSENGGAGPFRVFNTFEKSQITTVPVTEIQSLVIN